MKESDHPMQYYRRPDPLSRREYEHSMGEKELEMERGRRVRTMKETAHQL